MRFLYSSRSVRARHRPTPFPYPTLFRSVHSFDWPDRFVVGTVGPPGSRTFYLQARTGQRVVSVALEKEQTAALAEKIDEVLRSEEHTSELQSRGHLVGRLLLEEKKEVYV